MRIALAIAGSDPTGGAGLQMDLRVFQAFGVHGAGVVTALTVQDTAKVHQVLPAFPSVVRDQLRTLLRDVIPDAVKIGMLATDDVLGAVELGLSELAGLAGVRPPLVIDPVLHASSGLPLLERRAWSRLRELMAEATLVTPNLPEAEALTERDVSSRAGVESAARDMVEELGARAALVKGGHASGRPDDCLAMREPGGVRIDWLEGTRLGGGPAHGTGCALAAAVTASLAKGRELRQAVDLARAFLFEAIRIAEAPGQGARLLGLPGSVGPHEPA